MSEEHLGGAYLDCPDTNTFMPDIWQWLIDRHQIKSVIDVGCGAGWNTVWFHDRGLYAVGVEGWPEAIAKTRMPMQRMIVHDYTKGPLESSRRFDLCWSSEFVEHVEEQFVPNFMATFKCAKRVCMTYATPGQTGFHHVNEQPFEYWIERMKENGFTLDREATHYMRATDNGAAWGRRTLTLFENQRA